MNIDFKKAAIGAALFYVGYKKMSKMSAADNALAAIGALTVIKSIPLVAMHVA